LPITVEQKGRTAHSAALREHQKSRKERDEKDPTRSVVDPYFAPMPAYQKSPNSPGNNGFVRRTTQLP